MSTRGTLRIDRKDVNAPGDHVELTFDDPTASERLVVKVPINQWSQALAGYGEVAITYEIEEQGVA